MPAYAAVLIRRAPMQERRSVRELLSSLSEPDDPQAVSNLVEDEHAIQTTARCQGQRTFAVILATGDPVLPSLRAFVAKKEVRAGQIRAIGALSDVVLLYFDWTTKTHSRAMLLRRFLLAIFGFSSVPSKPQLDSIP